MSAPSDAALKPTPDYGTLGPGSGIPVSGTDPIQRTPEKSPPLLGPLVAMAIGIFAAVLFGTSHNPGGIWPGLKTPASSRQSRTVSPKDAARLDQMRPQAQAETLLEQAVNQSPGAVEQISARLDQWHGKVQWNSQIATLSAAALNSNDMQVRQSAVEVELAAYGLSKNSQSLAYLLNTSSSADHAKKTWALWALGLMANRGVQPVKIVGVLTGHLRDADEDSRRWAVEGLALSGTDAALGALLKTMHDDPSAGVRERAACGLAESGMFTAEQRAKVVPQLIDYTDDRALDAQTHEWAFRALNDITHQRWPDDSAAWREWYQKSSGQ